MTDNEIIEAFKCCQEGAFEKCNECPLRVTGKEDIFTCLHKKQELTFDLLSRQKAEIERLNKTIADRECSCGELSAALRITNELLKTAKSEAIKEFSQRLKEYELYMFYSFPDKKNLGCEGYIVLSDSIDSLVKEMTEGENEH